MSESEKQYAGAQVRRLDSLTMEGSVRSMTVTERLWVEKQQLEQRLQMVSEALAALEAQPEVTGVLDLLAKLGIRP